MTEEGKYERIFGWETSAVGGAYTEFLKDFLPKLKAFCIGALQMAEEKVGRDEVIKALEGLAGGRISFTQYPRDARFIYDVREWIYQNI